MSLLLNGAKQITIAGTEMSAIEIYTGESYTLPINFTYANSTPINCTGWALTTGVKYYTASDVTYVDADSIILGNLTLANNTYTGNSLVAQFTSPVNGEAYLFVPGDLANGTNGSPSISFTNSAANSTVAIITLGVTRTDPVSNRTNFNREPIGIIVRYQ